MRECFVFRLPIIKTPHSKILNVGFLIYLYQFLNKSKTATEPVEVTPPNPSLPSEMPL